MTRIDKLEELRIVSFGLTDNDSLVLVAEACDDCFGTRLTKQELGKLISELQVMHDKMKDNQ